MYRPKLSVDLEATNHCNAYCFMCPRESIKDTGFMSFDTFEKVISRLEEYGRIKDIAFSANGEPLLHKNIVDFIAYATKRKFYTILVTNGSLLTKETAGRLIKAGLKTINVSFSSNNPETYAKIHCGLSFETVKKNIEEAIELARGKGTMINLQISPTKFNEAELHDFIEYWYRKGIDFCFVFEGQHNRGGYLEEKEGFLKFKQKPFKFHPDAINVHQLFRPSKSYYRYIKKKVSFPCMIKQNVIHIDWKGNYLICCMDIEKKYILGNVKDNSVVEINKIKEGMLLKDYALCQNCSMRDFAVNLPPKGLFSYLRLFWIRIKYLWKHKKRLVYNG